MTFNAKCTRDATHVPPAAGCKCGMYGVEDVRNLAVYARWAELQLAYALIHEPNSTAPWARVVIARGVLDDAVRQGRPGGQELLRLYSDNRCYRFRPPRGVRPMGFSVTGDPAGTWRGSRFTTIGPVITQTKPGDVIERVAKPGSTPQIEAHLVPEGPDGETWFSEVLRRYTDSGRTDPRWWADQ